MFCTFIWIVAADWHELMTKQHNMRPSISQAGEPPQNVCTNSVFCDFCFQLVRVR